jgi:heptosyltransferase-3
MQRILVVVTRQIGDVLLTTPLIHAARVRWPGAAIDVLGFEGTLGMLAGNPDVHATIAVPARPGVAEAWRFIRRLWRRYDLALVADPGDRAHLVGFVAAQQRAGLLPEESRSNWWKRALLSHAVVQSGDRGSLHVVPEKLKLMEPWGAVHTGAVVAPASRALPDALAAKLKAGYIVVHTPSMWPYKQWPIAHFQQLVSLLAMAGRQVVLTGGPGAHDRACVAAMNGMAPASLVLDAGLLDFNQLAALLRGASLYIGPDTSVSHLAAACGTRVLALFGPTNPQRWAPWPAGTEQSVTFVRRAPSQRAGNVTILQSSLPCVPCGRAGCEDHRQSPTECLPGIEAGRVALQALQLLGAKMESDPE